MHMWILVCQPHKNIFPSQDWVSSKEYFGSHWFLSWTTTKMSGHQMIRENKLVSDCDFPLMAQTGMSLRVTAAAPSTALHFFLSALKWISWEKSMCLLVQRLDHLKQSSNKKKKQSLQIFSYSYNKRGGGLNWVPTCEHQLIVGVLSPFPTSGQAVWLFLE